jgi:predicted transcriptional regulator of viral defense system
MILLCLTHKYGYGAWQEIKKALRREQRCRFEHIFISRSEEELKKRIIYLVQSLEKEFEEEEKKGNKQAAPANVEVPDDLSFLDTEIE